MTLLSQHCRTVQSESETERKPEVPASPRDEALFHCAEPSRVPRGPANYTASLTWPGEFHSPWGHKESDTERLSLTTYSLEGKFHEAGDIITSPASTPVQQSKKYSFTELIFLRAKSDTNLKTKGKYFETYSPRTMRSP